MRAAPKLEAFTDECIENLPHPGKGQGEWVYPDPLLPRHRLVVKRKRKIFEVQAERPKRFGERRTFVLKTGGAPGTKAADARKKALEALGQIEAGFDPRASQGLSVVTTLGTAWDRYRQRTDLRPRTLATHTALYKRRLAQWANMPLATLSAQPVLAEDLHKKLTQEHGPSEANHALRLLRTIFRDTARRDRSLIRDQHPCTSVSWNVEKPAAEAKAIPLQFLRSWSEEVERLRKSSPIRASFAILNLRLGTRPGELARAKWTDLERGVLVLPETKTHLVEVPLTPQIEAELERLREIDHAQYPTSSYVFPARAGGHLSRLSESKDVLSYSGSSGRTSHHTIGVTLGIDDRILDVLEGRTLAKSGAAAAGRGYISRNELGPAVRRAQQAINDEIDRLVAADLLAGLEVDMREAGSARALVVDLVTDSSDAEMAL
jgi:integrase